MIKVNELTALSSIIDYYSERGEVVEVEKEVDSECELTGIISVLNALPRTPGVLFKKGKPPIWALPYESAFCTWIIATSGFRAGIKAS